MWPSISGNGANSFRFILFFLFLFLFVGLKTLTVRNSLIIGVSFEDTFNCAKNRGFLTERRLFNAREAGDDATQPLNKRND